MIRSLERVVHLAAVETPAELCFVNKLYHIIKSLSDTSITHCDVKRVSNAHLGLENEEDFFAILRDGKWELVTDSHSTYRTGTPEITHAIYIEYRGRYAFIVGDFYNKPTIETKEIPPL